MTTHDHIRQFQGHFEQKHKTNFHNPSISTIGTYKQQINSEIGETAGHVVVASFHPKTCLQSGWKVSGDMFRVKQQPKNFDKWASPKTAKLCKEDFKNFDLFGCLEHECQLQNLTNKKRWKS